MAVAVVRPACGAKGRSAVRSNPFEIAAPVRRQSSQAAATEKTSKGRGKHEQPPLKLGSRGEMSLATTVLAFGAPKVPRIDAAAVMAGERLRQCKRNLEEAIQNSKLAFERSKAKLASGAKEGLTHRTLQDQRQKQSTLCQYWATTIQDAINEGIDVDLPESLLQSGVMRIMELEEQAKADSEAAEKVYEARVAIAAAPIKTPVTKQGSQAALRAAAHGRNPLSEGSVVQLKGLEDVSGITMNAFDVNLAQYNGRRGRVSKDPPAWVIKAVGAKAGEQGALDKRQEQLGGLVPVLLESKITDVERHRGVWVAVPAANLKVLS